MKKKVVYILSLAVVLAFCMAMLAACGGKAYYYDAEAKITKATSGSETLPLMFSFNEQKGTAAVSGVSENCDVSSITVPKQVAQTKKGDGYVVTEVEAFAFADSKLKSITLPDSVTYIGNYAFKGCESLTELDLGKGVTEIGSYALQNCTALTSVTIGEKTETIGGNAFMGCTALKTVTFNTQLLTEIKGSAFDSCTALESIEIPASVTTLGSSVFRKCTSLKNVKLNAGIKILGNSLFSGCSSLEKITLPYGITSMGNFIFADCVNLAEIEFDDDKEAFRVLRQDVADWNNSDHTLVVKYFDGSTQTFVGTQLQ